MGKNKEKIEKLKNEIGNKVKVNCEFMKKNEKFERYILYEKMKKLYGNFDAFMDVVEININWKLIFFLNIKYKIG